MISIIIPTLNEEEGLPRTLNRLTAAEIIVVDAGSSDRTRELARELGATVIQSNNRQRAAQMNLGADHAQGDILLFLHADTIMPKGGLDKISVGLRNEAIGGGAFARRFDSPSITLKLTCSLAEIRNRAIGWHLGDQGIFVRRELFRRLGGFRLVDRFEDLDFSRRLGRITRLITLRPPVISSARRFEREGPVRRTVRDFLLTVRYLRGSPSAFSSRGQEEKHVC